MLSAVHPALADSRGIKVFWQETVFSMAIAVVVTVSMTWVGLLVDQLPAGAARGRRPESGPEHVAVSHPVLLLAAVCAGVAGLMTSYYIGSSAGAAITLYLAGWFADHLPAAEKGLSKTVKNQPPGDSGGWFDLRRYYVSISTRILSVPCSSNSAI